MYRSLRALGVDAQPSRSVEWAYESARGPLVVTVWHDQIEHEADGSLAYRIDALDWQAESRAGAQAVRAARMRELLAGHCGAGGVRAAAEAGLGCERYAESGA